MGLSSCNCESRSIREPCLVPIWKLALPTPGTSRALAIFSQVSVCRSKPEKILDLVGEVSVIVEIDAILFLRRNPRRALAGYRA